MKILELWCLKNAENFSYSFLPNDHSHGTAMTVGRPAPGHKWATFFPVPSTSSGGEIFLVSNGTSGATRDTSAKCPKSQSWKMVAENSIMTEQPASPAFCVYCTSVPGDPYT